MNVKMTLCDLSLVVATVFSPLEALAEFRVGAAVVDVTPLSFPV